MEHVLRASQQPPFGRLAAPGWVSAIGPDGFDAATGLILSPTTNGLGERTSGGLGLVFGTGDASSTEGAILPGISAGITAVMVATPVTTTASNNFLYGESAASVGAYNWGFYESGLGYLRAFVHNGASGVAAAPSFAWSTLREPTVLVMTYGDGDNNVRVYDRGVLLATAAQTGTIQRNSSAHLSVQRWNPVGSNFDLHAAGTLPWRMTEAEVLRFFSTPEDAIDTMFAERRILVPVAVAGGSTLTATLIEATAGTDLASASAVLSASLLDAAAGTDITSAQPTVARSLVDAAGSVDLVNAGAVVNGTLVEGVSAVDLSSALATLSVTVNEAVTAAELLAATRIANVAATEAAAGVDISSTGTSLSGSLVDAVVSADALSAAATLVASVLEAGGVVDQIHAAAQLVVLLTESAAGSDVVSRPAVYSVTATELVAALDVLHATLGSGAVQAALTTARRAALTSAAGGPRRPSQLSTGTRRN